MAARDDQLLGATRNYVIFGLLVVVALALAARERYRPQAGVGLDDSALRLMIVGGSDETAETLDEVDGFSIETAGAHAAVSCGREALDDPEAPAYLAAIACADQRGFGFVALERDVLDWQFDTDDPGIETVPGDAVEFVVFSVGDLAPEGPRMSFVELAPVHFAPEVAETDAIRLALYAHPDLLRLWDGDPPLVQLQAREVLRARGLEQRREATLAEQQRWRELAEPWPEPGVIDGSLAGPRERVRAAPIVGGVLVEVAAARVSISSFRHPTLQLEPEVGLYFVARAALGDDEPDETLARQRCAELPERSMGQLVVAPDGSALALREGYEPAQVLVFDEAAAAEGRCRASIVGHHEIEHGQLGRANRRGMMAWSYGDELVWYDGHGSAVIELAGASAYSGPWWIDDTLLAVIGDAPLPMEASPSKDGVETGLFLLDSARAQLGPTRVDMRELFGLPPGALLDDSEALVELRPSGSHELLLLTERCAEAGPGPRRPCLHRLRSAVPLRERVGVEPDEEGVVLETLGELGPYASLAIAADGSRALWVDDAHQLWRADLRGPAAMQALRVDADELPDASPRLSADGRLAISSVMLSLGTLGSLSVDRAFLLPPPAVDAAPPVTGQLD